jgi:DNA-binding MarR family transcriptional regulator
MKTKKELFKDIYNRFMRINNKLNVLQRIPMDYGSGEKLHPSEVHTVEAIAENEGVHMADLAKEMGVTRGAIMQMTGRLEKKGLVKKYMEDDNNKLVYFRLTPKGEAAYRGHRKYHQDMNNRLFSLLKSITSEEIEATGAILERVEHYVSRYVKEKSAPAGRGKKK